MGVSITPTADANGIDLFDFHFDGFDMGTVTGNTVVK